MVNSASIEVTIFEKKERKKTAKTLKLNSNFEFLIAHGYYKDKNTQISYIKLQLMRLNYNNLEIKTKKGIQINNQNSSLRLIATLIKQSITTCMSISNFKILFEKKTLFFIHNYYIW